MGITQPLGRLEKVSLPFDYYETSQPLYPSILNKSLFFHGYSRMGGDVVVSYLIFIYILLYKLFGYVRFSRGFLTLFQASSLRALWGDYLVCFSMSLFDTPFEMKFQYVFKDAFC